MVGWLDGRQDGGAKLFDASFKLCGACTLGLGICTADRDGGEGQGEMVWEA